MEHVLRLPGYPVWLRTAECQCQSHLPDAGCGCWRYTDAVGGSTAIGADRATDHRSLFRSHLDTAGAAPAVFSGRCGAHNTGAAVYAQCADTMGGGGLVVDHGCIDQRIDGTFPRVRRRPAADSAACFGLRNAEFLYRYRRGGRVGAALDTGQARGQQCSGCKRHSRYGEIRFLCGRGGSVRFGAVDHSVHPGVSTRCPEGVRYRASGRRHAGRSARGATLGLGLVVCRHGGDRSGGGVARGA